MKFPGLVLIVLTDQIDRAAAIFFLRTCKQHDRILVKKTLYEFKFQLQFLTRYDVEQVVIT